MVAAISLLFLGVYLIKWLWESLSNDRPPTPHVDVDGIARPEDRGPTWSYQPPDFQNEGQTPVGARPECKYIYDFRGIVNPSDVVRTKKGVTELDLHGLRVWEAIEVTQMFLKQSQDYYRRVRVITGRGLHSFGGAPRIKPEVETLLRNTGYKFKEMYEGGCLEVKL